MASTRILTKGTMKQVIDTKEKKRTDVPDLGPDEMRLYTYYRPGLVAGTYHITASQKITSKTALWGEQTLTILNTNVRNAAGINVPQEFEVMVPRFSLDLDLINSYYPPDGHQDEGRVLPHIVLNDPHFPWEIPAGITDRMKGPIDPHDVLDLGGNKLATNVNRNIVPWVALLVFDPEDLRFNELSDFTTAGLSDKPAPTDLQKQNPKGTFTRTVADYLALDPSKRIKYEADDVFKELKNMTSNVDLIFPTKKLFKQLFAHNETTPNATGDKVDLSAVEACKYMAHVRHINTTGCPDAGVEAEGLFSIVVSSRLGAYDIDRPHTQICHLVSIEHVDSTLQAFGSTFNTNDAVERVGMVSLFSWIYTALPPNPVNFVDTVRNLVSNQSMLTIDEAKLKAVAQTTGSAKVMANRLQQGYTLSRYRTPSGEVTAAFNRGPLAPGPTKYPISKDIPDCSNTSQDYQIIDAETGLVDLTYASAWQLGKTLALSDTVFSAALMRFRSLVRNTSVSSTQMTVNQVVPASIVLSSMRTTIRNVANRSIRSEDDPNRVISGVSLPSAPALQDPAVQPVLRANIADNVLLGGSAGSDPKTNEVYNEFNSEKGNNADWAIIFTWMCEKLNLGGIPPQYLMPEPSFLPPESLRFFHLDDFWLDSLLDGALSVANHLDSGDDDTRRQIKTIFNRYLGENVPRAGYRPQVPCCGFVIRSNLIKAMPDLRITVTWQKISDATEPDQRAPVCRWTKFDAETLFCLFDRHPDELDNITLAQPPHQQRFSLGSYVRKGRNGVPDLVQFDLRTLYSSERVKQSQPIDFPFGEGRAGEWPDKLLPSTIDPNQWLDFDTRVLKVTKLATDINAAVQFEQKNPDGSTWRYRDKVPNSCELGLELNDPSYYFVIKPRNRVVPTLASQPIRQLYVNAASVKSKQDAQAAFERAMESRASPNTIPSGPKADVIPQQPPGTNNHPDPRTAPDVASNTSKNIAMSSPASTLSRITPLNQSSTFSAFRTIKSGPLTLTTLFTRVAIYADYRGPPSRRGDTTEFARDDYIPDGNIYFYDLIFSIRRANPFNQDLLRIDIDIPMSPSDPRANPIVEPLLEADYYGPGVRMLSNQRFIPFLFYQRPDPRSKDPNGTLHIELRPRAATDGYAIPCTDARTEDVSFRLAEAPVSRVRVITKTNVEKKMDPSLGWARVVITEWYKTPTFPFGEPVRHKAPYVVIKKQITEDRDWDEYS